MKCKAKDNSNNSNSKGEHSYRDIPVKHTQEAIRTMQRIGVAKKSLPSVLKEGDHDDLEFTPLFEWLAGNEHIPPSHGDEGIISPVIGALIAVNPNCDNCQLTNNCFISRYLSKYIAKIDEYGRIYIRPPASTNERNVFSVQGDTRLNTKITSNSFNDTSEKHNKNSHKKNFATALPINIADVYMKYFDYPTILTNLRTVKISTSSYENRASTERKEGSQL